MPQSKMLQMDYKGIFNKWNGSDRSVEAPKIPLPKSHTHTRVQELFQEWVELCPSH